MGERMGRRTDGQAHLEEICPPNFEVRGKLGLSIVCKRGEKNCSQREEILSLKGSSYDAGYDYILK